MRRVEAEALVGASRGEIWQLLDDLGGLASWLPGVAEVRLLGGPPGRGTRYRVRMRAGLGGEADWVVDEHRRPARQVHATEDARLARRRILTLEQRGTGTRVHETVELRSALHAPAGWLHEVVAGVREGWLADRRAAALKRLFEERGRR